MNPDTYSEWLRRQGHHVYRTPSSYWYDVAPHILQAFPYGWLIEPCEEELRELQTKDNALALRYSTPITAPEGMVSYHVILEPPYHLDLLKPQARNGVRRGLSNATVEEIPFERLADEGWALQQDTLSRQNRLSSMSKATWERLCLSAKGLPGFIAWGALVNGELAAALITCQIDETFYVPYAASRQKFLNAHVNNALFYQVSCNLLAMPGIKSIFFSLHSLDAPESINEFKFRMGLQAKLVRQRVVFHPIFRGLAAQPAFRHTIHWLKERFPANSTLSKADGMLWFYANGKLPICEQDWPKCVSEQREKYLQKTA
ncbi:MAG: hypothetical protein DDG60_11735 [Anaerolineae bacterium]|nr:MAG: hypothetical protein DDG60_11735 [Anaerolineae bacterium]